MSFTEQDVPPQRGKCFVVTGANTGVGLAISKVLAARQGRVLMACRDEAKAREAMRSIKAEVPSADLAFVPLNMADLDSVRAAAKLIAAEPRLDVLLNNAGVMMPPLSRTAQGIELQMGVNHMSTFALSALLLPKLAQTPGSRIVVTGSLAHTGGKIDWDDINAERSYAKLQRYSDSKLANLMFFFELDRRLRAAGSPVTAVGCHPGVATTELGRHSKISSVMMGLARGILNTPAMGAWPALQCATMPNIEPGGYYGPQRWRGMSGPSGKSKRSAAAQDPVLTKRLWDVSIQMTGINPDRIDQHGS